MSDSGSLGSGPPADDDGGSDFDEWADWLDREAAAGRDWVPPERGVPAEGIGLSLGDVAEIDPGLLAAICGADGLGDEGAGALGGEGAGSLGERPGSGFAQDAAADVLPPGPTLAALTEAAVAEVARLSDDQLIGVLRAAQRQANREAWKKALVTAEFARRREAEFRAAAVRGMPVHCRPGQYPGEELAMELLLGPVQASHAIDDAADLTTRLPATLAGMAAGLIDEARAGVIAMYTRSLSLADAALADGILAAAAPDLRLDQLYDKAARLEMRLDPEAAQARKAHARRTRRRVEVRREESGNACVAGREMDTSDALAAKAHIHALALRLRRAGTPGTLDQLRLLVFADLTAGRDPLERIARPGGLGGQSAAAGSRSATGPGDGGNATPQGYGGTPPAEGTRGAGPADDGPANEAPAGETVGAGERGSGSADSTPAGAGTDDSRAADSESADGGSADGGPAGSGSAGSRSADSRPADAGPVGGRSMDSESADGESAGSGSAGSRSAGSRSAGSGSLDYDDGDYADDTDSAASAPRPAAPMPALINLVVPAGTLFGWDTTPSEADGWGLLDAGETQAIVTAAARHPATRWCVTVTGPDGTASAHGCSSGQHPWVPLKQDKPPPDRRKPAPAPAQAAQLAKFLRSLNLTLQPVASGDCDHAAAEPRYTPSRKLAHLVQARTMTCDAPGCAAQAVHADLDHTIPYPVGPTDQCNLGPKCRRHHKAKQAPDWKVEQPEPGVIRWTLPSGRTHVTRPTVYDPLLAGR